MPPPRSPKKGERSNASLKRVPTRGHSPAKPGTSSSGDPARKRPRDPDTRLLVVDAAINCILEQGFYRASSNAIAERAGLSWGVIQYYFGSREALMLAVLEEGGLRLFKGLEAASITGDSLAARIEEYIEIIERYYAKPEYLAFTQVLLNLSHDPRTSRKTRETMLDVTEHVNGPLDRLAHELFDGRTKRARELRGLVFHVARGLALSEVMLATLPFDTPPEMRDFGTQRRLLGTALSFLIDRDLR